MPLHTKGPKGNKTAGQRKNHFEAIRKNRVPRFLSRAFYSQSGGGPDVAINSMTEIVPRGFMNGREGHRFYKTSQKELHAMALAHYRTDKEVLTEFSSWAAFLHAILCLAQTMSLSYKDVHVAVLDRENLEGEVLIWWVPHLLDLNGRGDHEYLAHGCIRGRGYIAVPFKSLVARHLYDIYFEFEAYKFAKGKLDFGHNLRYAMFGLYYWRAQEPLGYFRREAAAIKEMSVLFGELSFPFIVAMFCLQPRLRIDDEIPIEYVEARRAGLRDWLITPLGIEQVDASLWTEPLVSAWKCLHKQS